MALTALSNCWHLEILCARSVADCVAQPSAGQRHRNAGSRTSALFSGSGSRLLRRNRTRARLGKCTRALRAGTEGDRHRSRRKNNRLFRSVSDRNYGAGLSPWTWDKIVTALAAQTDLPRFSPHTFRHLRLTHMARAGFKLLEIARYAGHRQLETTIVYIHLSGRALGE